MALLQSQVLAVDGYRERPVQAFHLWNDELSVVGAQDGCCLADAGGAYVFLDRIAGVGYLDGGQFVGSKELHLLVKMVLQHLYELLVALHVDGAEILKAWLDAIQHHGRLHLDEEILVVLRMMSQSESHCHHSRHIVHAEHPLGYFMSEGRYANQQLVFLWVGLFDVLDDGHVVGFRSLQIVGTLVAYLQQQGRRLTFHESKDTLVQISVFDGIVPAEALLKIINCP